MDNKKIQNYVYQSLIDTDTSNLLPIDVTSMAIKLGFAVRELPLDNLSDNVIALMLINAMDNDLKQRVNADKLIVLRKNYDLPHKRFAIAHELGHYFMHRDKCADGTNPVFFAQIKDNEQGIEGEACNFAAMLLMDARTFTDEYRKLKKDTNNRDIDIIRLLAKQFIVPQRAVQRRIEELELA